MIWYRLGTKRVKVHVVESMVDVKYRQNRNAKTTKTAPVMLEDEVMDNPWIIEDVSFMGIGAAAPAYAVA